MRIEKNFIFLHINGEAVKFLLDTGATCNIIPYHVLKDKEDLKILSSKESTTLTLFDGSQINSLGSCSVNCTRDGQKYDVEFQIIKQKVQPILGSKTYKELGFIKILQSDVCSNLNHNLSKDSLEIIYSEVIPGLGKIGSPCKIEIDNSAKPVVNAQRRIPYALSQNLKDHLGKMENVLSYFLPRLCRNII